MNTLSHNITPSDIVRNLGVTFDIHFNFRKHISLTCHSCFYRIRDLHRIRRYISLSVAKTIARSLITSRLDFDYSNSVLSNIASKASLKLQCVQNCLARVVTRSPRFFHSVPLLKSLHWLPVQSRIIFKLCIIACNVWQQQHQHQQQQQQQRCSVILTDTNICGLLRYGVPNIVY